MTYEYQQCTREDLEAVISRPVVYGVAENGLIDRDDYRTEGTDSTDLVDEYQCENCKIVFENETDDLAGMDKAWQEALDHLPNGVKILIVDHDNEEAEAVV